jgi:valyl-tRNA synthetase
MTVFKLFRDEFSSWYLEFIKPPYEKPIDKLTYDTTIEFFNKLLKLLHPFMPFLTEEIWQLLEDRKDGASIMVADLPIAEKFDKTLIDKFEYVKEIIANIRTIRKEKNIPFKDKLNLHIKADASSYNANFDELLIKANNLETLQIITEKPANSMSFIVKAIEYFVPVGDLVNNEEEIKKLTIELDYAKGFLTSVMKKLSNERFVQNAAPAVIELERKKQADAEMKIKALEEQIKGIQ